MVNEIRLIPGSMSGSTGLEFSNLKDSQMYWRTITKGKRSRKTVPRNSNECLKTVSESHFVEASSWQQLSNGSGCVPIKKRRHVLRTPSPPSQVFSQNVDQVSPQQQTSSSEDSESHSDNNISPGYRSSESINVQKSAGAFEAKVKEISTEKLGREAGNAAQFNCDDSGTEVNHMLLGQTGFRSVELKVKKIDLEHLGIEGRSASQNNLQNSENEFRHTVFGPTDETTAMVESKVGGKQAVVIGQKDDGGNSSRSMASQVSEQQIHLHEVSSLETCGAENDIKMKDAEDSPNKSEFPGNDTSSREGMVQDSYGTLAVENCGIAGNCSNRFSENENICSVDLSARGQPVVFTEDKGEHDKVFMARVMKVSESLDPGSKDVSLQPDNDLVSTGVVRDISILQDSRKSLVYDDCTMLDIPEDVNNTQLCGTQVDYDSPFEDGELRGSVLHSWEGNEIEDGGPGCVDYESDGRVGDNSDSTNYLGSVSVEEGSEDSQATGKQHSFAVKKSEISIRDSGFGLHKEAKENVDNIDTEGMKQSNVRSGLTGDPSSPMIVGKYDGCVRRNRCFDCMDKLVVRRSYMGEVASKVITGNSQSCVDVHKFYRKEALCTPYDRSYKVGVSQRNSSPDKLVTRYKSLTEHHQTKSNRQLNYWDRRHGHQSNCGGEDRQWTRSRSVRADSLDRYVELNSYENNQLKSIQPRFGRRSVEGDGLCDALGKVASIQSNRSWGSSESFSGGNREEYDEPVGDASEPFQYVPYHSSHGCNEREESLPSNKISYYRKSHSTIRLRSPSWQSPRDRNIVTKRHTGSRELKSPSSMERMRDLFHKPNIAGDYGEGCESPPRGRFSQVHNHKWASERNFLSGPPRQRKSPVRMFRQTRRLDPLTSSARLKSDDYFKPVRRSGRFLLSAGEGNRDKLINRHDIRLNERSGMLRSVRRCDTNAILRQSQLEKRDNFEDGNSYNEEGDFRRRDRRRVSYFAVDYGESVSPSRERLSPPRRYGRVDETNSVSSPWRHRGSALAVVSRTQRLDPVHLSEWLRSDDYF